MPADLQTRIADLLVEWGCGHEDAPYIAQEILALPNVAVVELPGETIVPTGWHDDCLGAWLVNDGDPRSVSAYLDPVSAWPADRYNGQIALPDGDFIPIRKAHGLAVALLAAERRASEHTQPQPQETPQR